jgi:hypothetical protein
MPVKYWSNTGQILVKLPAFNRRLTIVFQPRLTAVGKGGFDRRLTAVFDPR